MKIVPVLDQLPKVIRLVDLSDLGIRDVVTLRVVHLDVGSLDCNIDNLLSLIRHRIEDRDHMSTMELLVHHIFMLGEVPKIKHQGLINPILNNLEILIDVPNSLKTIMNDSVLSRPCDSFVVEQDTRSLSEF